MPVRRGDGVTMDVGNVDEQATGMDPRGSRSERRGADESQRDPRRPGPRRAALVAIIAVVVLASLWTWAERTGGGGDVTVSTVFQRDQVVAPSAPDRPVVRRWFAPLPDTTELVGVGVTDDLVVSQGRDARGEEDDPWIVQGRAHLDGEVAWERDVAGEATDTGTGMPVVVVLGSGDRVVPVTDTDLAAGDTTAIVSLDGEDGSTLWRHSMGSPGWVQVLADRDRALVHTTGESGPTSEVLDLGTGAVLVADDAILTPARGGWLRRRDASGEWDVLADDATLRSRVTSDATPLVRAGPRGDVVVTLDGTTLTATTMDGTQVWSATLPGTEPIPATEVDVDLAPIGTDTVLAGAYRASDNEVGRLEDYVPSLVSAAGDVTRLDDPVVAGLARQVGLTTFVVDGRPLLACTSTPTSVGSACPADLAIVSLDGRVTTRLDGIAVDDDLVTRLPLFGLVTQPGLVTSEDDVLRLRRWSDLSPAWSVDLPPGEPSFVVVTTDDGLAIAHDGIEPGITWLS